MKLNPFKLGRKGKSASTAQQPGPQTQTFASPPPPTSQPSTPGTGVHAFQSGNVSLVTYSPEELLQQVQQARNAVSFDLSSTAKFMDNYNQVWSWIGPLIFAIGTVAEIFIVLWSRQKVQDFIAAFSIIAVSILAEGTLIAVSFAAKRLRNRVEKRSTGWTQKEIEKLNTLKKFWFILALGVAATQVAFIVAQTNATDIGLGGVIAIALVRSMVALVADCYTAFASEEKPTSGEMALQVSDQEIQWTQRKLEQKVMEVDTINAGSLKVQEVSIKADMAQDRMNTEREIARLKNQAAIDNEKAEIDKKIMMDTMMTNMLRASFDTTMDDNERDLLLSMQAKLGEGFREHKRLKAGNPTKITEEY